MKCALFSHVMRGRYLVILYFFGGTGNDLDTGKFNSLGGKYMEGLLHVQDAGTVADCAK